MRLIPRSWRFRWDEWKYAALRWLAAEVAARLGEVLRPAVFAMHQHKEAVAAAQADLLGVLMARLDAQDAKLRDVEMSLNRVAYATESHQRAVEEEGQEVERLLRHLSRSVNGTDASPRERVPHREPKTFTYTERQ